MNIYIKEIDSGIVREWTLQEVINYINADRSDKWIDYDESDWEDGWISWCEGEIYTLIYPRTHEEMKYNVIKKPEGGFDNSELALIKEALGEITRKYAELDNEFEQYRRESIKWSVEDFIDYSHITHTITMEQAQMALEDMIRNHDAENGVTWWTIASYIEKYGTRIKEADADMEAQDWNTFETNKI